MRFICIAETGITSVTVYDLIKQSLKKYGPKYPIIPSYNNQHSHSYFMFKIDRKSRKWLPCNYQNLCSLHQGDNSTGAGLHLNSQHSK